MYTLNVLHIGNVYILDFFISAYAFWFMRFDKHVIYMMYVQVHETALNNHMYITVLDVVYADKGAYPHETV